MRIVYIICLVAYLSKCDECLLSCGFRPVLYCTLTPTCVPVYLCACIHVCLYTCICFFLLQGMILASDPTHSANAGSAGSLDIFVSSVGNDDAVDNPSNGFCSDVARLHARHIDTHPRGRWVGTSCCD